MSAPRRPDDELPVLAAVVARQHEDLSTYAGFLLGTLAAVVPADRLVVTRKRGLFGRGGADAPVLSLEVTMGERCYRLARASVGAPATASIAHVVGGIVLRTDVVPLDRWSTDLAAELRTVAHNNADVADVLARMTGFTV